MSLSALFIGIFLVLINGFFPLPLFLEYQSEVKINLGVIRV